MSSSLVQELSALLSAIGEIKEAMTELGGSEYVISVKASLDQAVADNNQDMINSLKEQVDDVMVMMQEMSPKVHSAVRSRQTAFMERNRQAASSLARNNAPATPVPPAYTNPANRAAKIQEIVKNTDDRQKQMDFNDQAIDNNANAIAAGRKRRAPRVNRPEPSKRKAHERALKEDQLDAASGNTAAVIDNWALANAQADEDWTRQVLLLAARNEQQAQDAVREETQATKRRRHRLTQAVAKPASRKPRRKGSDTDQRIVTAESEKLIDEIDVAITSSNPSGSTKIPERQFFAPGRGVTAKQVNKEAPGSIGQMKQMVASVADKLIEANNPLGHALKKVADNKRAPVNLVMDAFEAAFMTVGARPGAGQAAVPLHNIFDEGDTVPMGTLGSRLNAIARVIKRAAARPVATGRDVAVSSTVANLGEILPEVLSKVQDQLDEPQPVMVLTPKSSPGQTHYKGRATVNIRTGIQSFLNSIGHRKQETEGPDIGKGAQVAGFQTSQVFAEGREDEANRIMEEIHKIAMADQAANRMVTIKHNGVDRQVPESLVRGQATYGRAAQQLSADSTFRGRLGEARGPLGVLQSQTAARDVGNLYGAHAIETYLRGDRLSQETLQRFKEQTVESVVDNTSTGTSIYSNRLMERLQYNIEQEKQKLVTDQDPVMAPMRTAEIARLGKQIELLKEILRPDTTNERRGAIVFPGQASKGNATPLTVDQALTSMFGSEIGTMASFEDIVATIAPQAASARQAMTEAGMGVGGRPYTVNTHMAELFKRLTSGSHLNTIRGMQFPNYTEDLSTAEYSTTGKESKAYQGTLAEMFGMTNTAAKGGTIWDSLFHASKAATSTGQLKSPEELQASGLNMHHTLSSILQGSSDLQDIGLQGLPILDFAKLATSSNLNATQQGALDHLKEQMPELANLGQDTLKKLAAISRTQSPDKILQQVAHTMAPSLQGVIGDQIREQAKAAKMSETEITQMFKEHKKTGKVPEGFQGLFRQYEFWDPKTILKNPEFLNALELIKSVPGQFVKPGDTQANVMARMMGRESMLTTADQVRSSVPETDAAYGLQNRAYAMKEEALGTPGSNIFSRRYQAASQLPQLESDYRVKNAEIVNLRKERDTHARGSEDYQKFVRLLEVKAKEAAEIQEKIKASTTNLGDSKEIERLRMLQHQSQFGNKEEAQKALQELALAEKIQELFGGSTTFIGDEHGYEGTQAERYSQALYKKDLETKIRQTEQEAALTAPATPSARKPRTKSRKRPSAAKSRELAAQKAKLAELTQKKAEFEETAENFPMVTKTEDLAVLEGLRPVTMDSIRRLREYAGFNLVTDDNLGSIGSMNYDENRITINLKALEENWIEQQEAIAAGKPAHLTSQGARKYQKYQHHPNDTKNTFRKKRDYTRFRDINDYLTHVLFHEISHSLNRRRTGEDSGSLEDRVDEAAHAMREEAIVSGAQPITVQEARDSKKTKAPVVNPTRSRRRLTYQTPRAARRITATASLNRQIDETVKKIKELEDSITNSSAEASTVDQPNTEAVRTLTALKQELAVMEARRKQNIAKYEGSDDPGHTSFVVVEEGHRVSASIAEALRGTALGAGIRKEQRYDSNENDVYSSNYDLSRAARFAAQLDQTTAATIPSLTRSEIDTLKKKAQVYDPKKGKQRVTAEAEKAAIQAEMDDVIKQIDSMGNVDQISEFEQSHIDYRESLKKQIAPVRNQYDESRQKDRLSAKGKKNPKYVSAETKKLKQRLDELTQKYAESKQETKPLQEEREKARERQAELMNALEKLREKLGAAKVKVSESFFTDMPQDVALGALLTEAEKAMQAYTQDAKTATTSGDAKQDANIEDVTASAYALASSIGGHAPVGTNYKRAQRGVSRRIMTLSQPSRETVAKYGTTYSPELLKQAQDSITKLGGKETLTTAEKRELSAAQQRLFSHSVKNMSDRFGDNQGVSQLYNTLMAMAPRQNDKAPDAAHRAGIVHGVSSVIDQMSPEELDQLKHVDFTNTGSVAGLLSRNKGNENFRSVVAMLGTIDIGKYARFGRGRGTNEYRQAQTITEAAKQARDLDSVPTQPVSKGLTANIPSNATFFDLETNRQQVNDPLTRMIYQAAVAKGSEAPVVHYGASNANAAKMMQLAQDNSIPLRRRYALFKNMAYQDNQGNALPENSINSEVLRSMFRHAAAGGQIQTQDQIDATLQKSLTAGGPVVGHNIAAFDLPTVFRGAVPGGLDVRDTLQMSRAAYPNAHDLSSDYSALVGGTFANAHQAGADVEANRKLYSVLAGPLLRGRVGDYLRSQTSKKGRGTISQLVDLDPAQLTDPAKKQEGFNQLAKGVGFYAPLSAMQDFNETAQHGVAGLGLRSGTLEKMQKMFPGQNFEGMSATELKDFQSKINKDYLAPNMDHAVGGRFFPMLQMLQTRLDRSGMRAQWGEAGKGSWYLQGRQALESGRTLDQILQSGTGVATDRSSFNNTAAFSAIPAGLPRPTNNGNMSNNGGNNGNSGNNGNNANVPPGGGNNGPIVIHANVANVYANSANVHSGATSTQSGTTTTATGPSASAIPTANLQATSGLFGLGILNQSANKSATPLASNISSLVNAAGLPFAVQADAGITGSNAGSTGIQSAVINTLESQHVTIQVMGGNLTVNGEISTTGFGANQGGYSSKHSPATQMALNEMELARAKAARELQSTNDIAGRQAIQKGLDRTAKAQAVAALSGDEFANVRRVLGLDPAISGISSDPFAGMSNIQYRVKNAHEEKAALESSTTPLTEAQTDRLTELNQVNTEMTQFIKLLTDLSGALHRTVSVGATRPEYGYAGTPFVPKDPTAVPVYGNEPRTYTNNPRYNDRIQSILSGMTASRATAASELAKTNDQQARETIQGSLMSQFGRQAYDILGGQEFAQLRKTLGITPDVLAVQTAPHEGLKALSETMMQQANGKSWLEALGSSRTPAQSAQLESLGQVDAEMTQFIRLVNELSEALQKTTSTGLTRPEYGYAGTPYAPRGAAGPYTSTDPNSGRYVSNPRFSDRVNSIFNMMDTARTTAAAVLSGTNDKQAREGIQIPLTQGFGDLAARALRGPEYDKVRKTFGLDADIAGVAVNPYMGLQNLSFGMMQHSEEKASLEAIHGPLTQQQTDRLNELNDVNGELNQFIFLIKELSAALQKTTSSGLTRPEYGYAGTTPTPGGAAPATNIGLGVDKRNEMFRNTFQMASLRAMRNVYDQQSGILDTTGLGMPDQQTGYGSRNALIAATKDIGILGQLKSGDYLKNALSEARTAGLSKEAGKVEDIIAAIGKSDTGLEEAGTHLISLMHALEQLTAAAKGVSTSSTATTQEIEAAGKSEANLGKVGTLAQGAVAEQKTTSELLEKEARKRVSNLREGLQANASQQSFFGGFSLQQSIMRRRLLAEYSDKLVGSQNRDLVYRNGRAIGYDEKGQAIDLRTSTDAQLQSTQRYLQQRGVKNVTMDELELYRKGLQEERQTRNQSPMGNPLQYVTNRMRDLQFWSQGVMNLPDTITSTIQEATSPALTALRTMTTARAISLNPETYKNALGAASTQQQMFGGSLSKNVASVTSFIPIANAYGVDINKTVNVARKLAAFDPQQGMEGAGLAIKEFLSGNVSSLSRRFEINRSALSKINTGDASQMIDSLSKLLSEMGVTDRLIDEQANSLATKYDKMFGKLESLKINMSAMVVEAASGPLDYLAGPQSALSRYVASKQKSGALEESVKQAGDNALTNLTESSRNLNTINVNSPDFYLKLDDMLKNANQQMLKTSSDYTKQSGIRVPPQLYTRMQNLKQEDLLKFKADVITNQATGMTDSQSVLNALEKVTDYAGYQKFAGYRMDLGAQGYTQQGLMATRRELNRRYSDSETSKENFEKVKVLYVKDADTIQVLDSKGVSRAVRTYGIDAPESNTYEGQLAKKRLEQQVAESNNVAYLSGDYGLDKYGRSLSRVVLTDKNNKRFDSAADMTINGFATAANFSASADQGYTNMLGTLSSGAGDLGAGPVNAEAAALGLGGLPRISQEAIDRSYNNRYGFLSSLGITLPAAGLGLAGAGIYNAAVGSTAIAAGGTAGLMAAAIPALAVAGTTALAYGGYYGYTKNITDANDASLATQYDRANEQLKIQDEQARSGMIGNAYRSTPESEQYERINKNAPFGRGFSTGGSQFARERWKRITKLGPTPSKPGTYSPFDAASILRDRATIQGFELDPLKQDFESAFQLVSGERGQRFAELPSFAQKMIGGRMTNSIDPTKTISRYENNTNLITLARMLEANRNLPEDKRNAALEAIDKKIKVNELIVKHVNMENLFVKNSDLLEQAVSQAQTVRMDTQLGAGPSAYGRADQVVTESFLASLRDSGNTLALASVIDQLRGKYGTSAPTYIEEAKKYNDAALEKRQQLRGQRFNNVMDYVGTMAYANIATTQPLSSNASAGDKAFALTMGTSIDASATGIAKAIEEQKAAAENSARNYAAESSVNKEQASMRAKYNAMFDSTLLHLTESMKLAGDGFDVIYEKMSAGDPNFLMTYMNQRTGVDYLSTMQQYQLLPGQMTRAATGPGLTGYNQIGPSVQFGYSQGPRGTMQYVSDAMSNPTMLGQMNGGEMMSMIMTAAGAQTELVRRNIQQGHQMRDLAIQNARSIEDINRNAMIGLLGIHRNYTNQMLLMQQQDEATKRTQKATLQELVNTSPNLTTEQREGFNARLQTGYHTRNNLNQFNLLNYLKLHPEDTAMTDWKSKLDAAGPEGSDAYQAMWKDQFMPYVQGRRADIEAQSKAEGITPEQRAELEKQAIDLGPDPTAANNWWTVFETGLRRDIGRTTNAATGSVQLADYQRSLGSLQLTRSDLTDQLNKTTDPKDRNRIVMQLGDNKAQIDATELAIKNLNQSLGGAAGMMTMWSENDAEGFKNAIYGIGTATTQTKNTIDENMRSLETQLATAALNFDRSRASMIQSWADAAEEVSRTVPEKYAVMMNAILEYNQASFEARVLLASGDKEGAKSKLFGAAQTMANILYPDQYGTDNEGSKRRLVEDPRKTEFLKNVKGSIIVNNPGLDSGSAGNGTLPGNDLNKFTQNTANGPALRVVFGVEGGWDKLFNKIPTITKPGTNDPPMPVNGDGIIQPTGGRG